MPHDTTHIISASPSADSLPLFPGENIVFSVRPHILTLLVPLLGIAAVVVIAYFFLGAVDISDFLNPLIPKIILIVVGILLEVIFFLGWLNTIYLLTNKRVQRQSGIIGKKSSAIALSDVQATRVELGIFGRIFGFGDVLVESAAFRIALTFKAISNPRQKKELIDHAQISP